MGLIEKIGYQSSDLIIGTMPNLDKHVKAITSTSEDNNYSYGILRFTTEFW